MRSERIKINWYPDEIKFIQENYILMTDAQLLDHINRFRNQSEQVAIGSLRHERHRLGCNRMTQDRWKKSEIKFLRGVYTLIGDIEIANYLTELNKNGRVFKKKNIEKKRSLLGLKRTPEQLLRIKNDHKICGRYQHGKTWKTRGAAQEHDTRVWRIAGRRIRVIKTGGKFVQYNRWFYKNNIGEIPAGYSVCAKDGNPLNSSPENLVLLIGKDVVLHRNKIRASKKKQQTITVAPKNELFNSKEEWF